MNGLEARTTVFLKIQQTFTALKYRNYRLWFVGQLVSLLGTWMQMTAQGYFVYELTHSPAYLGYVAFASGVPTWLFMLYGGVIVDRMSKRTLLIATQVVMMLLAFILAGLTFCHVVQPWHIIALSFGLGFANAFDAPARQAFVLELVEREDLTNAIALNSTMFNLATAIGPAVAGITYALYGPAWCFMLNGLSFIAIIIALAVMRFKSDTFAPPETSPFADLLEGVRYVASHSLIRTLISLVAVTTLLGMSFTTLIPAWAVKILNGDATTNGFLLSARGIGSLIAALSIASLGRFKFKGRLLSYATFALPTCLFVFAILRFTPLSLVAMIGVGGALIIMFNLTNALIQTIVPDRLRGRVMSVHGLSFFGLMPIGGLLAGFLAEYFGLSFTVIICSAGFLAFALFVRAFLPELKAQE